jgi:cell division protein FtsZ
VHGAKGVLVNITGEVTMRDMTEAMTYIEEQVGSETNIINGYIGDASISGETRVTIIVTGFKRKKSDEPMPPRQETCDIGSGAHASRSIDYSIPAYIRRQTMHSDGDPHEHNLFPQNKIELQGDRIQKGLSDTPAYLRRMKKGNSD